MLRNRFTKLWSVLVALTLFTANMVPVFAADTTPQAVNYQGRLLDSSNTPLSGSYVFRFSLWDSADLDVGEIDGAGAINTGDANYGGWNEVQTTTTDSFGLFNITVGSVTGLPPITSTNQYLMVEVKAGGAPDTSYEVLDPNTASAVIDRKTIQNQPFANNADTLDNADLGTAAGNIATLAAGGVWDISRIPGGTNADTYILDNDGSVGAGGNIALQFGTTVSQTLQFDVDNDWFEFGNDLSLGTNTLTGAGGATLSGAAVNLNNNSDFGVNLGTGTSTGTVSIGGGAGSVAVNSTTWNINTAGAASGFTTFTASGNITTSGGDFVVGSTGLSETNGGGDNGASIIGVDQSEFANSASTNVQDVLDDFDALFSFEGIYSADADKIFTFSDNAANAFRFQNTTDNTTFFNFDSTNGAESVDLGVNLDFAQNQAKSIALDNLAAAPGTPVIGQIYHNTTDSNTYVWNGVSWDDITQGAGSAGDLDDVYDNDANKILAVDNATGLSFDSSVAGDIVIDLQSTGDFVVQDNGTPFAIFSDGGQVTFDSNAANTVSILTLENTAGDFQLFRTDATPESAVTASIGDIAVDGTNGTAYIKNSGGATNTGWQQFAGSVTKEAVFTAEYQDATATGDGSNNKGLLSSYFEDGGGANKRNYYEWETTQGSLQDVDVTLSFKLPLDFVAFTGAPLSVTYRTNDGTPANNQIDLELFDTTGTSVSLTGGTDLANASWTTANVTFGGGPTFTAGETVTLRAKLQTLSSGWARIADIVFSYIGQQ